jgi:hypothetical protein
MQQQMKAAQTQPLYFDAMTQVEKEVAALREEVDALAGRVSPFCGPPAVAPREKQTGRDAPQPVCSAQVERIFGLRHAIGSCRETVLMLLDSLEV